METLLNLRLKARATVLITLNAMTAVAGPLIRRASRGRHNSDGQLRVLLIRVDLLGDVVFSLSTARLIKTWFPAACVDIVTLPGTAQLAQCCPDIRSVVTIDTNAVRDPRVLVRPGTMRALWVGLRRLRQDRYDVVLSLQGPAASMVAMMSKSPQRVGFADESFSGTLELPVVGGRRRSGRRLHDEERSHLLAAHAFNRPIVSIQPDEPLLYVQPQYIAAAEKLLGQFDIEPSHRLVAVHAGSSYGDFKRWPEEYYRQAICRLAALGVRVVLTGSPTERDVATRVAEGTSAISVVGRTSLPELLGILKRAELVVSGDSGPLHMAAALGTPVLGLYGPTDPLVNGPVGERVAVLRHDIACSPCYSVATRARCPMGDPICMRMITVDEVIRAVESSAA